MPQFALEACVTELNPSQHERLVSRLAQTATDVPHADELQRARVTGVMWARDQRKQVFNSRLFSDPAWDMLLVLYAAELRQRRITITRLARAAGVAETTSLRWVNALLSEGLITRRADPLDRRRAFVSLSDHGRSAMRSYFDRLPPHVETI